MSMKHLKTFEGLFDFLKNPIKYREDMPVSKRMKENNIKQIFKKDPDTKKEIQSISYLMYNDKDQVATLNIDGSSDDYGRPFIKMKINELGNVEKIVKTGTYLNQEKAIKDFLQYWETKTKEGQEKNKEFKLKKY